MVSVRKHVAALGFSSALVVAGCGPKGGDAAGDDDSATPNETDGDAGHATDESGDRAEGGRGDGATDDPDTGDDRGTTGTSTSAASESSSGSSTADTGETGTDASSGSSSGGSSSSSTSSEDSGPPQFLTFGTNVSEITRGESVVFSAVLTDPDGIDDVIGGTLENSDGSVIYGAFATSGQEGAYSLTLSWTDIDQSTTIEFSGDEDREFTARFFDNSAMEAARTATIRLHCDGDGNGACDGFCVDRQTSSNHCGVCDNACTGQDECFQGNCTNPTVVIPPLGGSSGGAGGFPADRALTTTIEGTEYVKIAPSGGFMRAMIVFSGSEGRAQMADNLAALKDSLGYTDMVFAVLDGTSQNNTHGGHVLADIRADYNILNDQTYLLSESDGTVSGLAMAYASHTSYFAAYWANDLTTTASPPLHASELGFAPWGNAGPGGNSADATSFAAGLASAGYRTTDPTPYDGAGSMTHGSAEQFLAALVWFDGKTRQ